MVSISTRDFALLTKQMLYFDRFMRTLAPDMDMFSDQRVQMLGQDTIGTTTLDVL